MADTLVDDLKRALGDAYTIERELTGGGMSRVFVAKEHALGREVVIKVLPPDLAAGVNRDRFRREVQLAARLSHPYIVPLLHAGEHDELLWFTMPYIPGESLRTRLQRTGALKLPEVVKLLRDVVEELAYAHSRGVIHRDIKPGNILYDGQHAVVTDFGVAKALNAALPIGGPGHTASGMAIGTPAYMAPEQLAADPAADQRVDIYAVGLLAYELLSGASPFAAPSPTATMTAQLTRIPEPLHQLRADVPPAFSDLVQHCLAKAPDDRPRDAQAVLAELDRVSGALAADVHRGASGDRGTRPHASLLPLVLATIGVLALVAGGFWWTQRGRMGAALRDTTTVPLGSDTADFGASLPAKAMTRQDSVNLLETLREQLGQIAPKSSRKPVAQPKAAQAATLDVTIHAVDSLIRVQLRAAGIRGGDQPGVIAPPLPGAAPTTPATPMNSPTAIVPGSGPHRLAIFLPPNRRPDSVLQALQRRAALELVGRTSNRFGGRWDSVFVDSSIHMGRPTLPTPGPGVVLVYLGVQRDNTDSVRMSISVRSNDPGTDFGYQTLTSDPVHQPANIAPFNGTLNDAARLLGQLRRLPPGQPWPQDMGRGLRRGGPSDHVFVPNAGVVRTWTTRADSMKRAMDSLRARVTKPRDSVPE